jgi:hypothetical protein
MYEYGITSSQGKKGSRETVPVDVSDEDQRLSENLQALLRLLWERYTIRLEQVKDNEKIRQALVNTYLICKVWAQLEQYDYMSL